MSPSPSPSPLSSSPPLHPLIEHQSTHSHWQWIAKAKGPFYFFRSNFIVSNGCTLVFTLHFTLNQWRENARVSKAQPGPALAILREWFLVSLCCGLAIQSQIMVLNLILFLSKVKSVKFFYFSTIFNFFDYYVLSSFIFWHFFVLSLSLLHLSYLFLFFIITHTR